MKIVSHYLLIISLLIGSLGMFSVNATDSKGLERIKESPIFKRENKVAIVIGIDAYDSLSGLRPLRYAAADAQLLSSILKKQGYIVRTLTNQKANKNYILTAIEEAGKTLSRNTGTLIFAYSGHGFASGKKNYLASHGTVINKLASSGLALSEVQRAIRKTGARRAMLFIDACRNNPDIAGSKSGRKSSFIYSQSEGMKVLYSTKFGDVSWESPQLGHGVFSHFLIKALQGAAADRSGIISFDTVKNYVQQEVANWTFKNRMPSTQRPFSSGNSYGVLVVGQRIGFQPPNVRRPKPIQKPKPVVQRPRVQKPIANIQKDREKKLRQLEEKFWQNTKQCNQVICYRKYLNRYPIGKYAVIAKKKVKKRPTLTTQRPAVAIVTSSNNTKPSTKARRIGKYIDHGDGTVTDTQAKLMWKKCSEGQTGKNCLGNVRRMSWVSVMKDNMAGRSYWRVPSLQELNSLKNFFDQSAKSPAISPVFPNTPQGYYWSSNRRVSPFGDIKSQVMSFMSNKQVKWEPISSLFAVRLVRDVQ